MSIIINEVSLSELTISKDKRYLNVIGLTLTSIPIIVFVSFMVLQPYRIGDSLSSKIISIGLVIFLLFYLSRVIYLHIVDKKMTIVKDKTSFKINNKSYLYSNVLSLLIIEYSGFRTMPNGYNLCIKLHKGKKIHIAIRVNRNDKELIKEILNKFLNIEKFEEKKWWIF